ncbi:uncharacterized protein LOC105229161 [Bactrocera dorsalis]|uniref:Uncharacterized protein LOC105229161 n=1 Tax=Bactrocera dorsalis TaxID=27457 RepID=A0A034WRG4_BACDO|nr:uncharacterized protein LOC105229161 [Bactrocera dorsalis]
MLARIIKRGLLGAQQNFPSFCANRHFTNEYSAHIPGGGLEKLAGCFKEESYFKLQDLKLLLKMREQTLRGAGYDTSEMNTAIEEIEEFDQLTAAHRQQSFMNKHKNCMEELYFLTEESMNLRRLEQKMHLEAEQKMREDIALENRRRALQFSNEAEAMAKIRSDQYTQ